MVPHIHPDYGDPRFNCSLLFVQKKKLRSLNKTYRCTFSAFCGYGQSKIMKIS